MYTVTFIRLVEDEYRNLLNECNALKQAYGLDLYEKPSYICERVQKFRNWLTMAIRSAEITKNGGVKRAEDVLLDAAVARTESPPFQPMHKGIISALRLFLKNDLEGILGEKRRLTLEQAIGDKIDTCRFEVCYSHCQFIQSQSKKLSHEFDFDQEPSPFS